MNPRQETPVAREDVPDDYRFQASITAHPVIRDEQGVIRYARNILVASLFDQVLINAPHVIYPNLYSVSRSIMDCLLDSVSLNDMWLLYQRGAWSRDELRATEENETQ